MLLEHFVNYSIYNYPTLYRSKNYSASRLKVLDHLFFVIGNGYEWKPEGYLCDHAKKDQTLESLPEGFFEKNLYDIDVTPEQFPKIKASLGDCLYYSILRKDLGCPAEGEYMVIFEAKDDDQARKTYAEFRSDRDKERSFSNVFVNNAISHHQRHPYPLCQYSALVELTEGKTNSFHVENFDLIAQPDWLDGCIEAALDALLYFDDESRYKNDMNHPSNSINRMKYDSEKAKKEGKKTFWWKNLELLHKIKKIEVFGEGRSSTSKGWRWTCSCGWHSVIVPSSPEPDDTWAKDKIEEANIDKKSHQNQNPERESIEYYCSRIWEQYRASQIETLNKFFKKFIKETQVCLETMETKMRMMSLLSQI